MDTKLKNNHKKTGFIHLAVILICTLGMLIFYPVYSTNVKQQMKNPMSEAIYENYLEATLRPLVEGNYLLYNEVSKETGQMDILENYNDSNFNLLKKYMDYNIFDEEQNAMLEGSSETESRLLKADTEYAVRVEFVYGSEGELTGVQVSGTELDKNTQFSVENALKTRWSDMEQYGEYDGYTSEYNYISTPEYVSIIYGMSEENLSSYIEANWYGEDLYIYQMADQTVYIWPLLIFSLVAAGVPILLALYARRRSAVLEDIHGSIWSMILKTPAEIALIIACWMLAMESEIEVMVWKTVQGEFLNIVPGDNVVINTGISYLLNIAVWFLYFFVIYWAMSCIGEVFIMKKQYFMERSLIVRGWLWLRNKNSEYGNKMKNGAGGIWQRTKKFCRKQYDALLHIDFRENSNRVILRIVLINFAVIFVLSFFWIMGIWASVLYSIVLFIFLRKYYNRIQNQYKGLLRSTNQLAEGNLDMPISGDVGIFNPVQEELKRIQAGFKRAVDEEVKSERMKTDLITNVSHDLKTPLTAIITYTDLVKNETDEEKRREYIGVLERKSLRLKVLIEDLFEISKATSRNVTLHYMKIDIVDLLKQVGLEYDSNIKNANLDFKWNLPDHKIVLWLDSQKTYRIFENMIVNITKYAMPHTRVYISMTETDDKVNISMKNISAEELNFNTDEITDRFVRGDVSRNTEGSGLGLAIAKSFTELQHGILKISTEADLFRADIMFPKRRNIPEEEMDMAEEKAEDMTEEMHGGDAGEENS